MVERFDVVSISLFECACCHAYVAFCAICVACSDCGVVNYAHCSWSGHVFFSLQGHGSMTSHCGLLFLIIRVLCLEIIDLMLVMQLTLTVFQILCSLWLGGKCLSIINKLIHDKNIQTRIRRHHYANR